MSRGAGTVDESLVVFTCRPRRISESCCVALDRECRFEMMRKENVELAKCSARCQTELHNAKDDAQRRSLEDAARIQELRGRSARRVILSAMLLWFWAERLQESERQLAHLPSILKENAKLKRKLENAQNSRCCSVELESSRVAIDVLFRRCHSVYVE